MKSYTDIEQSKKLAEILPIESADMCYIQDLLAGGKYGEYKPYIGDLIPAYGQDKISCWSLAALLGVVSEEVSLNSFKDGNWNAMVQQNDKMIYSDADNPVDACYEMIIKLNKQKLL